MCSRCPIDDYFSFAAKRTLSVAGNSCANRNSKRLGRTMLHAVNGNVSAQFDRNFSIWSYLAWGTYFFPCQRQGDVLLLIRQRVKDHTATPCHRTRTLTATVGTVSQVNVSLPSAVGSVHQMPALAQASRLAVSAGATSTTCLV